MGIETNKKNDKKYRDLYYAYEQGTNSRLDEIQAAMLSIKLSKIKKSIKTRQNNAKIYFQNLNDSNLILPNIKKEEFNVFYELVVRQKKR